MGAILQETPDLQPPVVYQPKYEENQQVRFMKFVNEKYKIKLNNYWELQEWSCKNYPEFWECVWLFFEIVHSQPYTEVFDRNKGFTDGEWFKGVRLNYTQNIFKHRDSHTAIITIDDADNVEYITYQQLYNEVCIYVAAFKAMGIRKGDVVTSYMPNKKEAILAFLATASIGAVWSGALPLLGPKAVLSRYQQINPKILFTAGNFVFEDTEIRMDRKIPSIISGLPSLEKVVFVPSKTGEVIENMEEIPKCCTINEFLDPWRKKFLESPWELEYEQVSFNHPLCINFTSGTTGLPKGLIHSTLAIFAALKDYGLQCNCTREDVLFNFSPAGWVSWHMFLNCLHLGLTLCVYEGDPYEKSPTRFWDLIDRFGITMSYIWSSTVDNMETKNFVPTKNHSLKTLRQLNQMGSPAKPRSFTFLTERVKPGLFCSPVYGCTEYFGTLSGLDSNLPVYKGEIQCFGLGFDIRCIDENGKCALGKRGDLVVANPSPVLPVRILNDETKEKVTELYLSKYPGYWDVGDDAWINPITKGFIVYGRGDETMNPKGARFNCAEIYFALDGFPGLKDSVCVSHFNSKLDERVILFVKMASGHSLTPEIENEIKRKLAEDLSIEHVPDIIIEVPDIPYNLTGKKLNSLVKKLVNKKPVANTEIVINPKSVEFFKNLDLGDF